MTAWVWWLPAPVDVPTDNMGTSKAPALSGGNKHKFLPALIKCNFMACPETVFCQR